MSKELPDVAEGVVINGKQLACVICGAKVFHHQRGLISSRKKAIFNLEWLGKEADVYVCGQCGFVHWFLPNQE
jgi:hypothetical protein